MENKEALKTRALVSLEKRKTKQISFYTSFPVRRQVVFELHNPSLKKAAKVKNISQQNVVSRIANFTQMLLGWFVAWKIRSLLLRK